MAYVENFGLMLALETIQPWLNSRCNLGPDYQEMASTLYYDYVGFVVDTMPLRQPQSISMWGRAMSKYDKGQKKGRVLYRGIALRSNLEAQQ